MKIQEEILAKIDEVAVDSSSDWQAEAIYRLDNKAWLQKSQSIALKILRTIRAQNLSQKELAQKLDVSPQQVSKWLKGNENFTLETIVKIESILKIELISVNFEIIETEDIQALELRA